LRAHSIVISADHKSVASTMPGPEEVHHSVPGKVHDPDAKDAEYQALVSPVASPQLARPTPLPRQPNTVKTRLVLFISMITCLAFLALATMVVEENPVAQLTEWINHVQFRPNEDEEDMEDDAEGVQEPDDEENDLLHVSMASPIDESHDEDQLNQVHGAGGANSGENPIDNTDDAAEEVDERSEVNTSSSHPAESNVRDDQVNDDGLVADPVEQRQKYGELVYKLINLYSKDRALVGPIDACHPNQTSKVRKGTFEFEVLSADCGLGYDFANSTSKYRPWKVALYGSAFDSSGNILNLSGCLVGAGKCPQSPQCQVFTTRSQNQALAADVVVIFQNDVNLIHALPKRDGQYRILYWREAFFAAPSPQTQKKFDFEMGVHYFAGLLNPQFFRTPTALLGGITYPHPQVIPFLPVEERPHFAMSIISNCGAASQRQKYIDRLIDYLGQSRIHRYGRCGNMQLPPPPVKNAAKIIARYKFYLSFENTIEDGYVTEKLLHVLAMPVVPVYYGSPTTPNITVTPSFINVADFSHPKHLADYLMHLDHNPSEYYRYHEWRTDARLFHPDFLRAMQMKSPGPYEMLPFRNRGGKFYPRSAACCRLCDENYLQWAARDGVERRLVQHRMGQESIKRRFFQGDFYGEPKA